MLIEEDLSGCHLDGRGQHFETAVGLGGRFHLWLILRQLLGAGHAARAEIPPCWGHSADTTRGASRERQLKLHDQAMQSASGYTQPRSCLDQVRVNLKQASFVGVIEALRIAFFSKYGVSGRETLLPSFTEGIPAGTSCCSLPLMIGLLPERDASLKSVRRK